MDSNRPNSDIAFSASVKRLQERDGARERHIGREARGAWSDLITPELALFIAERDSFYLATSNAEGQPYIQHRGGPPGFLVPIDDHTLAMADFAGNRQFITQGNLLENDRACIFLMDYARRRRIKIWGVARMVEDDPALLQRVMPCDYAAVPQRILVFKIKAWDSNCPQHIPRKIDAAMHSEMLASRDAEIERLKARIAELEASASALDG